jgi:hypothetical protein
VGEDDEDVPEGEPVRKLSEVVKDSVEVDVEVGDSMLPVLSGGSEGAILSESKHRSLKELKKIRRNPLTSDVLSSADIKCVIVVAWKIERPSRDRGPIRNCDIIALAKMKQVELKTHGG